MEESKNHMFRWAAGAYVIFALVLGCVAYRAINDSAPINTKQGPQ